MRQSPEAALAGYRVGDVVLTRVASVESIGCVVALFPEVTARIEAVDLGDAEDLRLLIARGQVIRVQIVDRNDEWLLVGAKPEQVAIKAASILVGGPPWLLEPTEEPVRIDVVRRVRRSRIPADLDAAITEIGTLRRENDRLRTQIKGLTGELKTARDQLAESKQARKAAEASQAELAEALAESKNAVQPIGRYFLTDRQQLDFEIDLAWARRVPAADKPNRPLAGWSYGPEFFETLHTLEGIDRSKVVDVIVEVLTGLDTELSARGLHQLRSGDGGDDAPRVGPHGETYWRVALQQGTPGARRLHYSRAPDGFITLFSVRHHDDLRT
jgi:hypothetical protein